MIQTTRQVVVFSLASLLACPMLACAEDIQEETWNAHFQTTYIWQAKPSFPAAYSGDFSLRPEHEKAYSFSATASLGWRPWRGGELYFDPELVQGVPLSDLRGLAGMTNGEQQKTSGPNPTLYRARLYLRQTWSLGGAQEAVESDWHQLAGMVAKRRVVVTAGNLAVVDIFDNSAFAHDARTQFMNWALLAHGAYDFAADARGYTWGAAIEYFHDDWVLRGGRFMQPAESNGLTLDTNIFRHYGDQIELEHAHVFRKQPGKLRILAFRSKADMGSFRDALADAPNNGGASETYAFTEIERSVSAGAVGKGGAWKRGEDSAGIAVVRNGLSGAHRDYLAAGGHGAFIGDGRLNYRPESIVEAYYSMNVAKDVWVSLDYQRIVHPAYNADRGPVNMGSLRVHAQY